MGPGRQLFSPWLGSKNVEVELFIDGTIRIPSCEYPLTVYLVHDITQRCVNSKFADRVETLVRARKTISTKGTVSIHGATSLFGRNEDAIKIKYSKRGRSAAVVINGNGRTAVLITVMKLFGIERVRFLAQVRESCRSNLETEYRLCKWSDKSQSEFRAYLTDMIRS
jgi:hypothetical protein